MRLESVKGWAHSQDSMTIEMEYIGKQLSSNYRMTRNKYTGDTVLRSDVRKWMDELSFAVRVILRLMPKSLAPPIRVRLDGFFKDKRTPDLHNLEKVVCDAVKEGIGIDDKLFITECGEPQIGDPKIVIRIEGQKGR